MDRRTARSRHAAILRAFTNHFSQMSTPTLVVAEDDFLIRDGYLLPLLTPHFSVLASVGDGLEAVEAAETHKPDVMLLDVSLPRLRGFDAARKILLSRPDCKIVFVSNYSEPAFAKTAFEMGASGYVLKNRVVTDLIDAIRSALAGEFYWPNL